MGTPHTRTCWYVGQDCCQDILNLVNDTGQAGFIKFRDGEYETIAEIAKINYSDIEGTPAIPTTAQIQTLVDNSKFSGAYADLSGKPQLFSGSYSALSDLPVLFDGNYVNLTNKPELFNGAYSSLSGLPTIFDGNYVNLTNKPELFNGAYSSLSGLPTLFNGAYSSLSGLPTIFDGNYVNLTNKPALFNGAYSSLSGLPTLFNGAYSSLSGLPTLFSGSWNNLSDKPTLLTTADVQTLVDEKAYFADNYFNIQYKQIQIFEDEIRIANKNIENVPEGYIQETPPTQAPTANTTRTVSTTTVNQPMTPTPGLSIAYTDSQRYNDNTTLLNIEFNVNTNLTIEKIGNNTSLSLKLKREVKHPRRADNIGFCKVSSVFDVRNRNRPHFIFNHNTASGGQDFGRDTYIIPDWTIQIAAATTNRGFTDYNGEWIMIDTRADPFILTKIRIWPSLHVQRAAPGTFKIYGANTAEAYAYDNSSSFDAVDSPWTQIHDQTTHLNNYQNNTCKEVAITTTEAFSIYIMVVNKLAGNDLKNRLWFTQWELFSFTDIAYTTSWENITPQDTNTITKGVPYIYTLNYTAPALSVELYKNYTLLPKLAGSPLDMPAFVFPVIPDNSIRALDCITDIKIYNEALTERKTNFIKDPTKVPPHFKTLVDDALLKQTSNQIMKYIIDNEPDQIIDTGEGDVLLDYNLMYNKPDILTSADVQALIDASDPVIGGELNISGKLIVNAGSVSAHDKISPGALCIGDTSKNYGFGNNWSDNTAGILMECLDNTEIAVHDSGQRVVGLLSYKGGLSPKITIGRWTDWGGVADIDIIAQNVKFGNNLHITGLSPTIHFTRQDQRSGFIHVNSNLMYFLCGGVNATTWTIVANQRWPLYLNLTNNNAVFGGNVDCMSLTVNGLATFKMQNNAWINDDNNKGRLYFSNNLSTYIRGYGTTPFYIQNASGINRVTMRDNGTLTAASFSTTSDRRIKKDIQDVDDADIIQKLTAITPKKYRFKNNDDCLIYGFIAQEIKEVLPCAVSISQYQQDDGTTLDDFHWLEKDHIFTVGFAATQILHKRIEAQRVRIEELEAKLASVLAHLNL